jgi:hypothetical protein
MSDWKETSHFLTFMAHKFGIGMSTPDAENGFQILGSNGLLVKPELDRKFSKMTPKQIRRWLWDVRYDPVWQEADVLVYVERESPTSWVGRVGRIGSPDDEQAIVFTEAEE